MSIGAYNLLQLFVDYWNRKLYFVEAINETNGVIKELSITEKTSRAVIQYPNSNPSAVIINPVDGYVICVYKQITSKTAANDDKETSFCLPS
jgi:hypothetical protein